MNGDLFDDLLGEDQSDEPARKNPNRKTKESSKPAALTSENEIDNATNDDDDDGDDESGGLLEILDGIINKSFNLLKAYSIHYVILLFRFNLW